MNVNPEVIITFEPSWLVVCFTTGGVHKAKVVPMDSRENLIAKLKDPRIVGAHVFRRQDTAERFARDLRRAYKNAGR